MRIVCFLIYTFLLSSCAKETAMPEVEKVSKSYLEAHLFAGGGRELKDNYLPEVNHRLPYERWNFIKIPPLSKGYLYNSLKDTPWIEPMFLSFEVDYNTVQSNQTQRNFDLNMDYFVYTVDAFILKNGQKEMIRRSSIKYLIHKQNPTVHMISIQGLRNPNLMSLSDKWFGKVDINKKEITFEVYILSRAFGVAAGKWQMEDILINGYKEPGDTKVERKYDSIVFKYKEF